MSDRQKFGLIILTLVFLVMGGYYSLVEITYLAVGKETTGAVTRVTDYIRTHRGHETRYRQVEFTFAEPNGTQRSGEDTREEGWTPPANGVVRVQYTPGEKGRARLAGQVKWFGFVLLAIGMVIILFGGVWLLLDARKAYRPRPRKKKKRVRYRDD